MKKRIISFLVLLSLLISLVPTQLMASTVVDTSTNDVETTTTETETEQTTEEEAESTTHPDWEYEIYGDGVALTKYLGTSTDIYVPNKLEVNGTEYTVLKLADSIFENNDAINSITLASGILEIGAKAFYDCDNLVCILVSEELTTIGAEAFYSCNSFNSVILYDNISAIGENAFAECPSLTIWCNDGTVGYNYAVANSITYEILNPDATPEIIEQDGITYYILNGNAIVVSADTTLKNVVIPSDINGYPVTEIREAFKEHYQLVSIILPNSLKTIGNYSFYYCTRLKNIEIPESVTTINSHAFCFCTQLTTLTLYNNITHIGHQAFDYCYKLTDVYYYGALEDWCNIEYSGSFSSPMQDGKNFYSYGELVTELDDVFDGWTTIDTMWFSGFDCVTKVVIPSTVTSIGNAAFASCTGITELVIPQSVTSIGTSAFKNCCGLTSIILPNKLSSIGQYTFYNCENLKEITFGDNVMSIDAYAFGSCISLESVNIPNSVTTIGSKAFDSCTNLKYLIIPSSVTSMKTDSFPSTTILMVEENSYAHEFASENGLLYSLYDGTNLPEIYDVDNIRYFIQEGKAIAMGVVDTSITEAIIVDSVNECPVVELRETFKNCSSLESVTLPNTLEIIGSNAFYSCSKLSNIEIPNSVITIGKFAFYSCSSITSLEIPNSVTIIDSNAFASCTRLASISLGDNLLTIGGNAFNTCSNLSSIVIPNSVTTIGSNSFYKCTSLTSIVIPDNVTSISGHAFGYCTNLESVTIGKAVTSIGGYAFYGCTSLAAITIPSNVESIGMDAFRLCNNLKNVNICEGVKSIANYAFYDCPNIVYAIIPSSVNSIGVRAFPFSCALLVHENSYAQIFAETKSETYAYAFVDTEDGYEFVEYGGVRYLVFQEKAYGLKCVDSSLKTVVVPKTVNSARVVGLYGTFNGCTSIQKIELPNTLEVISNATFYKCSNLKEIVIPEGVTRINLQAFESCKNLKKVVLPSTLISLSSFSYCTSLELVNIPTNLTTLGMWQFDDCANLRCVFVPSTISTMYTNTFAKNTILMVEENSYAHTFAVENNLLYFVVHKTENPEIAYGSAIEGTVTNSDGTVASGVTVEIYYEDGTLKESVTTDENGKYAFTYAEVGKYTIKAYNSYGNTASTVVYVKRMNVFDVFLSGDTSITLKTSYTVSGSVSENATVKLTDLNGNVISTVTGDGFTFTNVANGTYLVVAENENGSASQEITVFNSNVTDINLEINTDTAKIWGYVEVEDRDNNKHRRHWVEVSVYNEQGNVIATQKSDKDGKYSFENLPFGDYSIVAKTTEMRPDKKYGYDRSYELYGYAYISITESGTYEIETIVLYEENDYTTTVSGKANINKDKSKSCEFIMYNAFGVEYAKVTSENGKYSFKNVKDGLYIIMALTENDGMGFTVIVVRNGKIHGNTNINIVKADKIKDREDKFENEIPDFESKEQAEQYRQRIADEKRFYDSLSEKEKKQLSNKYIQRLNKYIEWLAGCENNEGVENSGLVISGDEIEKGDDISFTITVEKQEKWEDNKNGIETSKDFIHHNMKDKAGKGEIVEYYEISMTKTSNGSDKVITSVYKDTDAMGKFRVTLEIPEEYKGMKHYSLVHVHCGEVTVLTDLDDNPDTITVEIDKFSTFALATTDEDLVDEAVSTVTIDDIIKFKGYSVGPDGTSMCVGFDIDMDALEAYEKKTGKTIDFGAVFTSYDLLGNNTPLNSVTGEANELEEAYVLKTSLKDYSYTTYDFVLTDITDDIANHNFVIAGYIYDEESVLYIQSDTVSSTVIGHSLNGIKEQQ